MNQIFFYNHRKTAFHKIILLTFFAMAITSIGYAENAKFTVTLYNLKEHYSDLASAENAWKTPSLWNGSPITKTYGRIAFIYYLIDSREPHFKSKMVDFPGVKVGSHKDDTAYVLEAASSIFIPKAGEWTFACGSDDGIKLSISGHGLYDVFPANGGAFRTSLKTITFPQAGKYTFHLFYWNHSSEAALELSVAQGGYLSFDSSVFHLVGESESGVTCVDEDTCIVTFDGTGGKGKMEAQMCMEGQKLVLPKNTFSLEGYRFAGWAKAEGGPVVYADGAEVTVTEDMTLFAVWKRVGIIRLHGNGMATAAGEKTYDIPYTFGEELKLPENPFVEYENSIVPAPKELNLLGWSVGTSYFDWTKHRLNSLLSERGRVLIYDNPDDVLRWGGVTEKEGTVVDLYAIWKTRLTVKLRGPQGGELSPAALKPHVFAKLSYEKYENKWHNGEWTMMVPPGTHQLTARVDSEFQDYAKGWQVWQDGQQIEVEDGASSTYTFEIPTDALPGLMDLEMRFQGVGNEYGSVWFEKKWKMTPEQEGGLKNFPAFDPAKVSIRIRRKLSESWGELDITEDSRYGLVVLLLPVGEYEAYFEYADRYWDVYEYDGRKRSFTVDSEDPQRRIVEAVFMPFGVDYYYEFLRDRFERLNKLDVEGKTTAAVPAGVSTIATGAFADAGSLVSIRFGGDAPAVEAGGLDGLSEGAVVRVARGTTGWGEVPGTWQGRTLAYDSLAELDAGASAEKVATALTEVAAVDGVRIAAAVGGNAVAYESFREWAQSVKGGETSALDSPHAAASWKLGAAEPLANEPVAVLGLPTDVDVVGGATVVSVAVRDGDEVAEVDSERVAGMIETAASPLDWSEENRLSPSIEATSAGDDGELRFSVVPGEEGMPAAFFRLRLE